MKTMRSRYFYFQTVLSLVVAIIFFLAGCASQEKPQKIPDALIQLPFEESLENLGKVVARGDVHSGEIKYKESQHGMALQTQGDGSWVAVYSQRKIDVGGLVEISFSFKRANWENPYIGGSGFQTIATVNGKDEKRINHLSFGFLPGASLAFYISFTDDKNKYHTITTREGAVSFDWHEVKLRVDMEAGETILYFDGNLIDRKSLVPVALIKGIDRIIFGTWFRKNQAYRGLIDDFVIRDIRISRAKAI
jgi:hypothetical protein